MLTMAENSRSTKKTLKVAGSAFLLAFGLVGCGKNSGSKSQLASQPDPILVARCASPHAFNGKAIDALNSDRFSKMSPRASTARGPIPALVLRTYVVGDETQPPVATEKTQDQMGDSDLVKVELDCPTLAATYAGPGIDGILTGKLKQIKEDSLVIVADNGDIEVTISRDFADRETAPTKHNEIKMKKDMGIIGLNIKVVKKNPQTGQSETLEIRQETALNQDAKVKVKRNGQEAEVPFSELLGAQPLPQGPAGARLPGVRVAAPILMQEKGSAEDSSAISPEDSSAPSPEGSAVTSPEGSSTETNLIDEDARLNTEGKIDAAADPVVKDFEPTWMDHLNDLWIEDAGWE